MSIVTADRMSPPATVASIVLCRNGSARLAMGHFSTHTADELAESLSTKEWGRFPVGQGSKRPTLYDLARVCLFRFALMGLLVADPSLNLRSNG
jgi:hypothetical protein